MNLCLRRLNEIKPLDRSVLANIAMRLEQRSVFRDEYLIRAGQFADSIVFVESGVVAAFIKKEDAVTYTDFCTAGDFLSSAVQFARHERSTQAWIVRKPGSIYILNRSDYEAVCREHPEFVESLLQVILEVNGRLQSQVAILREKPGDRFASLKRCFPGLPDIVPAKHLANFCNTSVPTLRDGNRRS